MTVTNYEELKAAFELVEKEKDKNLKGYAFDSLVFRYQLARKEQAILDTEKIAYKKNISKVLDIEYRVTKIYSLFTSANLIKKEYQIKPIIKENND